MCDPKKPDAGGQLPTDLRAEVPQNANGVRLKIGVEALDPLGRTVSIIELHSIDTLPLKDAPTLLVKVRMRGPYAGTVTYPASVLRPVP